MDAWTGRVKQFIAQHAEERQNTGQLLPFELSSIADHAVLSQQGALRTNICVQQNQMALVLS